MTIDYRKFSNLERYLLDEVGPHFAKTGHISPLDFYMIIIWKANRAKTHVLRRLSKQKGGFDAAVKSLAASVRASNEPKRRLEILMGQGGFRLPMASAILTILYPDEFSVYDYRVCEQLGAFGELANRGYSDRLWDDYQQFLSALRKATPDGLSLRDKDHYLWGRSFYQAVEKDIGV